MRMLFLLALAGAFGLGLGDPAEARSLAAIRESGSIGLCAHPNSLPFASKSGDLHGFQIELGEALAAQLGVSLSPDWILIAYQVPRTTCDIMLDMVAVPGMDLDFGIRLSKPYYRSGIALAVRQDSPVAGFGNLNAQTKIGVLVGSVAAMTLDQRHIPISVFGFEEDMLAALAAHEIDAAAVTPAVAGYYNATHPGQQVTIIPPDEAEPQMVWNVAVGMRHPDAALRDAIEGAMAKLAGDGTLARIYGRYGMVLQAPK